MFDLIFMSDSEGVSELEGVSDSEGLSLTQFHIYFLSFADLAFWAAAPTGDEVL